MTASVAGLHARQRREPRNTVRRVLARSSSQVWLPQAKHVNLAGSRGNGPFGTFYGVVLHVNVSGRHSNGTDPSFYAAGPGVNPDSVCPNFQVMRDGTIWQMLPLSWQPWTQVAGNYNYASIETGGDPDMPLTPQQTRSVAVIVAAYHKRLGMPLVEANRPGQRGLGVHSMGGAAWGGHPCPGAIRAGQRPLVLKLARGPVGPTDPDWSDMATQAEVEAAAQAAVKALIPQIAAAAAEAVISRTFKDGHGDERSLITFLAGIPGYKQPGRAPWAGK